MSFIVECGNDQTWIGYFGERAENQFTFVMTDMVKFLKEELDGDTLTTRIEEANESIRYRQGHVIRTMKQKHPERATLDENGKVEITWQLGNHPMNIFFHLQPIVDLSEVGSCIVAGFMKLVIEQKLQLNEMRKVIEAKDLEIEEYKNSGAVLNRESLATVKFNAIDFKEEMPHIQLRQASFDPLPLLNEIYIPKLCAVLKAENILEKLNNNLKRPKQSIVIQKPKRKPPAKSRPLLQKCFTEKEFAYEDDDEDDSHYDKKKSETIATVSALQQQSSEGSQGTSSRKRLKIATPLNI